ncbi:hypothetical protein XENTR_v10002579 [Xenopus tropicalis]|nr:hypothetical protein XENTR_v10002579 [Xenopus tropicalis]
MFLSDNHLTCKGTFPKRQLPYMWVWAALNVLPPAHGTTNQCGNKRLRTVLCAKPEVTGLFGSDLLCSQTCWIPLFHKKITNKPIKTSLLYSFRNN